MPTKKKETTIEAFKEEFRFVKTDKGFVVEGKTPVETNALCRKFGITIAELKKNYRNGIAIIRR